MLPLWHKCLLKTAAGLRHNHRCEGVGGSLRDHLECSKAERWAKSKQIASVEFEACVCQCVCVSTALSLTGHTLSGSLPLSTSRHGVMWCTASARLCVLLCLYICKRACACFMCVQVGCDTFLPFCRSPALFMNTVAKKNKKKTAQSCGQRYLDGEFHSVAPLSSSTLPLFLLNHQFNLRWRRNTEPCPHSLFDSCW